MNFYEQFQLLSGSKVLNCKRLLTEVAKIYYVIRLKKEPSTRLDEDERTILRPCHFTSERTALFTEHTKC